METQRVLGLVAAAALGACNGGDSSSFEPASPVSTAHAVRGDTPLALSGRWIAFLADEATSGSGGGPSTDLNGDTDTTDQVAVVVDAVSGVERSLGVAARGVAWVDEDLYLAVDETEDGRNWEPVDTGPRQVLLHASPSGGDARFVDTLDELAVDLHPVGERLFYASGTVSAAAGDTNLRVVEGQSPLVPRAIFSDDAAGGVRGRFLAEEEGLLFAGLAESVTGRSLNGDLDTSDLVLALLDGTGGSDSIGYVPVLASTRLAVPESGRPLRARARGSHDWLVAFLVSEARQGQTNLNSPALFVPAWQPVQCPGSVDVDAADEVLHWIDFADWLANPFASPPVNTGIAGGQRIAVAGAFLATIVREGGAGACDLDGDGDVGDSVVRWVATRLPVLPQGDAAATHAVAPVPGGASGLTELGPRFVLVADEAAELRDLDRDGALTHHVVGWLDPRIGAAWFFDQGGGRFIGASWLGLPDAAGILPIAAEEEVLGLSINAPSNGGIDVDATDSFPAFAGFAGGSGPLVFPKVPIAVQAGNAGMESSKATGFYRVSEADDSRDWNGDGDTTDFVLLRSQIAGSAFTAFMSVLNALGRPAVEVSTQGSVAAFIADETFPGAAGEDLNLDGDATDLVVRFFRLP